MDFDRAILGDIFAFVAAIVAMGCFTGMVITWMKFRARKFAAASSPELISRLTELSDRVQRMDTAIDAIAVEIERISEGQRFTTRLLAERPAGSALSEIPRANASKTPH